MVALRGREIYCNVFVYYIDYVVKLETLASRHVRKYSNSGAFDQCW